VHPVSACKREQQENDATTARGLCRTPARSPLCG
jgi:hypothetical protein